MVKILFLSPALPPSPYEAWNLKINFKKITLQTRNKHTPRTHDEIKWLWTRRHEREESEALIEMSGVPAEILSASLEPRKTSWKHPTNSSDVPRRSGQADTQFSPRLESNLIWTWE